MKMLNTLHRLFLTLGGILLPLALPLPLSAETPLITGNDVAAGYLEGLEQQLQEQAATHGRYSEALLTPLEQLIRYQMELKRLQDAASNADYAIQIVRSSNGLNTPQQYDWQQLAIDIDLYRQDWKAVNKRMEYYSGLILSEYYGSAADRVMRLLWLGNVHVRGAIDDDPEQEAKHLRLATWYAATAVTQAQKYGLQNSRLYAEMLYALSQRYYLEARAILDGGSTSYRLRMIQPDVHHVRDKFVALDRRYQLGLAALMELRDMLQHAPGFGPEAGAMAELAIADWKAVFDESEDLGSDYQIAIDALLGAGVSRERINRLLADPVAIPRPRFAFRAGDSMAGSNARLHDNDKDRRLPAVSLLEPSPQLAGFAQEAQLLDWQGSVDQDWAEIKVGLTVDPNSRERVRNNAFLTRSRVTASQVVLHSSEADADATEDALKRISTLSFRPAFVDGQTVASELVLEYLVRNSEGRSTTPIVTENWVASFQVSGRGANPAATGE